MKQRTYTEPTARILSTGVCNLIIESFYASSIERSRDSSVGIATARGWTAGVRFPAGEHFFLFSSASIQVLGSAQPHIELVAGTKCLKHQHLFRVYDLASSEESFDVDDCGRVNKITMLCLFVVVNAASEQYLILILMHMHDLTELHFDSTVM
jgi:hypothetical protein